jgi:hypothetical protein
MLNKGKILNDRASWLPAITQFAGSGSVSLVLGFFRSCCRDLLPGIARASKPASSNLKGFDQYFSQNR